MKKVMLELSLGKVQSKGDFEKGVLARGKHRYDMVLWSATCSLIWLKHGVGETCKWRRLEGLMCFAEEVKLYSLGMESVAIRFAFEKTTGCSVEKLRRPREAMRDP